MNARPDPRIGDYRSDPRTFCGRLPWPLIVELADGTEVAACYVVHESRRAESRANKPYLKLLLGDRTGTIEGYIWDDADQWEPLCAVDSVVGIRARVASFQDRLQLRILRIEPLHAGAQDLEYLLPASPRPRDELEHRLDELIASISDAGLRRLLLRCLGRGTELGRVFRVHPAAKRNHHAYLCGLLEHSVSVATTCVSLCEHYSREGVSLDRDLLVAGALLHDIGKIRELKSRPGAGYTTEGQLLGHILIGIQLVSGEAERVPTLSGERLLLLQHLIASHQGKPEWDSPKVPQLLEAVLLHYADDLDAKMNHASALLSRVPAGDWSAYDRALGRSFFHPADEPREPGREASLDPAGELSIDLFRG